MYYAVVAGFMVILPIVCVGIELFMGGGAGLLALVGKWFVFWAVGARLFTAGLRQIIQPDFTARTIFEITDPAATKIVSELGIANVAIGTISLASLWWPAWVVPAAICGLIFYGVAGLLHVRNPDRNRIETVATVSDLWVAGVLAVFLIGTLF